MRRMCGMTRLRAMSRMHLMAQVRVVSGVIHRER